MKKLLATAIIAAVILYLGNQLAATQVQAEAQDIPQVHQNLYEVYGKIKQANGNEIIVVIGNLPSSGRSSMSIDSANTNGEVSADNAPTGEARERPSGTQDDNQQAQDERPSTNFGNAENMSSNAQSSANTPNMQTAESGQEPQESRGAGSASAMRGGMAMTSMSLELTDEEKTFLIPVTAKITTGIGENERTLRFTQLAYKNTVKLSLNENGDLVAVNVLS